MSKDKEILPFLTLGIMEMSKHKQNRSKLSDEITGECSINKTPCIYYKEKMCNKQSACEHKKETTK